MMIFEQPVPLSDAVKILLSRNLMPTNLDTAGLRALDLWLRNQSLYSAKTLSEHVLGEYRAVVSSLLQPGGVRDAVESVPTINPPLNPVYARVRIQDFLRSMGYAAEPGTEGTLQDLSSDARVKLVIKTNVEMAQGQGKWLKSQDEVILDEWPADELFRAESRVLPRDWLVRWQQAGAATGDPIGTGWTITPNERLIALRNHAIWRKIGSSALFTDGLDQPWPPFAFNSGMWTRYVNRKETERIGLIKAGMTVKPQTLEEALR